MNAALPLSGFRSDADVCGMMDDFGAKSGQRCAPGRRWAYDVWMRQGVARRFVREIAFFGYTF